MGDYEIRYFNGATLSVKPWKDSDLFLDIKWGLSSIYAPTFAGYSVADVTILSKVQSQSNVRPYEYGFEDGKVVYHNGHETRVLSKGAEITFYQDANGKFVSWDKKHGAAVIEDFEALRKEDKSVVTSTYISPQPSVRGANKGLYKGVYFYEKPLEDKEVARVKGMIAIKEAYQSVIDIQSTDDYDIDEFQSLLTELNETYDMFVKEYGYINTPVNTRLFERDDRFPLIASLEEEALDDNDSTKVVFEKAKAFFEPTIRPKKSLEQVDSAEKALSISLSEGRGVDLDFMLTLYPAENKEVLLAEIYNEVAPNIQKYSKEGIFEWELKTDLLSGDVVTKKELLELLVDKGDTKADWEYYLSLINEVVPEPVTMVDMEFNIGSMWIPNCVLGKFAYQILDGYEVSLDSHYANKAGNQLAYTMQFNVSETTKFVTLAKYRGFELKALTLDAPYRQGQALDLKVVGKNMYSVELDFTSPVGTIQRINNVIDSLDKAKIRLEQLVKNQQLIVDKGIADSVFADEERLAYVKAKYEVLLPLLDNDASVEEIEKALEEFSKQNGSEDNSVNVLDKYLEVSQDDVEEIQLLEPQNETVEVPSEEDSERPEREEDNSDKLKLALQFLADAELLLGQADEPTEVVFTSETTITVCEQLELF